MQSSWRFTEVPWVVAPGWELNWRRFFIYLLIAYILVCAGLISFNFRLETWDNDTTVIFVKMYAICAIPPKYIIYKMQFIQGW